jgi:hypothetical protein
MTTVGPNATAVEAAEHSTFGILRATVHDGLRPRKKVRRREKPRSDLIAEPQRLVNTLLVLRLSQAVPSKEGHHSKREIPSVPKIMGPEPLGMRRPAHLRFPRVRCNGRILSLVRFFTPSDSRRTVRPAHAAQTATASALQAAYGRASRAPQRLALDKPFTLDS